MEFRGQFARQQDWNASKNLAVRIRRRPKIFFGNIIPRSGYEVMQPL
jgi:hypothetical protein